MAIDQRTMDLIRQKALSGQKLSAPTAEKQAMYDKFKPFDKDAYLKEQLGQVNSIYDNQTAARTAQFNAQRDKALGLVNQQKAEILPQYANKRNQTDVVNAQNVNRLREMMAANGIASSGENVTANVGLQSARQGALSQLNLQEQQTNNDFNRQIADINNPAELNAMLADLNAQRSQALMSASNRADELGYGRSRDSVMDNRYTDETQYGRGRDSLMDNRYNDETKYSRGLDSRNWNYQLKRDGISDSRYKAKNSGGGSYGYSSGGSYGSTPKLPSNPTPARIMTQQQYIDAYEQPDARKKGTARVLPGSTDYAKKMQRVLSDLYK